MNKSTKLITALEKGQSLTAAQIRSRFNIANPSATVHKLRGYGHDIKLVKQANGTNKYSMR